MVENAEILAAVVTRWAMPLASAIVGRNMQKIGGLNVLQNKIRSTGLVSPEWCIMNEMSPFFEPTVNAIVRPMLKNALSKVPDESIPQLAHGIVDTAISKGELVIMDGTIRFDKNDLYSLKRLLNANLPFSPNVSIYQVKEENEQ